MLVHLLDYGGDIYSGYALSVAQGIYEPCMSYGRYTNKNAGKPSPWSFLS